jgi:hypothetical protein
METPIVIQEEILAQQIYILRGKKVMFDFDLSQLYEIETRALKQQVKRNIERFPADFMFILSEREIDEVVSQNVIPSRSYLGGGMPMVFTEQGVAMLSSILKSKRAILVNIAIMRTFVNLRQLFNANKDLVKRIDSMEERYEKKFALVFEAIKELIRQKNEPREMIGYKLSGSGLGKPDTKLRK